MFMSNALKKQLFQLRLLLTLVKVIFNFKVPSRIKVELVTPEDTVNHTIPIPSLKPPTTSIPTFAPPRLVQFEKTGSIQVGLSLFLIYQNLNDDFKLCSISRLVLVPNLIGASFIHGIYSHFQILLFASCSAIGVVRCVYKHNWVFAIYKIVLDRMFRWGGGVLSP
jgi:hypothetical protein